MNNKHEAIITPPKTAPSDLNPLIINKFSKSERIGAKVKFDEKYITDRKCSFQCHTTEKTSTVITITEEEGIIMVRNVLNGVAPSTYAASSSSFGNALKNCIYM